MRSPRQKTTVVMPLVAGGEETRVGAGDRAPAPRSRVVLAFAVAACLAAVGAALLGPAAQASSADAPLLVSRFVVNSGVDFTNSTDVRLGDGGSSPFFRPGVLVWDGGSILGGNKADPGMDVARQTMRLVPHPCLSRESISPDATIVDMLNEASTEVDVRHDARADIDACVVMAGGGDIEDGRRPAAIYEDLVRYCRERREAGFLVVVVTLLPRSRPTQFETDRQAFNKLERNGWPGFADGLADIAADSRIGDPGDNLDHTYYCEDALHPNTAGCGVMAAVAASVLNGLAWLSTGCELRFCNAGGQWTGWQSYVSSASWQLESGDGPKTVLAEYRDRTGTTVGVSDDIGLDTGRPTTRAPIAAGARRGGRATLCYRVNDPAPSCGRADATIRIRRLDGRLVKTIKLSYRKTNTLLLATFTCWLGRGSYRFFVSATDEAGNRQSTVGHNRLTVR